MLAVIRLRSIINAKPALRETLKLLRLNRIHHCILLSETPANIGMLRMANNYVTWGAVSDDVLKALLLKRGRKSGDKRLTGAEVDAVLTALKAGKKLKEVGIKPVFRLTPPSGGFYKEKKQAFPNGELGNRKEKINDLLERMI